MSRRAASDRDPGSWPATAEPRGRSARRPTPSRPSTHGCQVGRRCRLTPGLELAERALLGFQDLATVQRTRLSGRDLAVIHATWDPIGSQMR
jgi:hypothetical protein